MIKIGNIPLRRALWIMFPLGFASGLPLALSGGTLQAWLATSNVDIKTIGIFSIVGLPYTFKFLWSPLMDAIPMPFMGRRRGWILCCQALLTLSMVAMSFLNPSSNIAMLGVLAILLAFFSASQDIVIDAYRTDILKQKERGLGVGFTVTGYRMAMLVSGALALILADHIGWNTTYLIMAGVMAATMVFTVMAPRTPTISKVPKGFTQAVVEPLVDLLKRPSIGSMLLLIVLYKLGDAFAGTLTTAFLIRGAGFTPTDVGTINKGLGLAATIIGAITGGSLMTRIGLYSALMYFGILQAISNLAFMILAMLGKNYPMMVLAVGLENICGGMGTAAFVALLMALCNVRFSATQYALLSALASVGRVFVGPPSGLLVASLGWTRFFFFTFLAALPGLVLLYLLKDSIASLDSQNPNTG